jgi:outer membrane protein assembly factor BamB
VRHFGPEVTFTPQKIDDFPDKKIRAVALPDGRILLSRFGTVYMLDASGREIWKFQTDNEGELLTSEPAYNAETNEIGIVGSDILFVRLDATTGEEKWRATTVGAAEFIHVAAYGKGFLIVVDMSGYREKYNVSGTQRRKGSEPDKLEYYGETEDDFWSAEFPIGAQLLVNGQHIYAVRRTRNALHLRELQPALSKRR